jgi:hypothetical protein
VGTTRTSDPGDERAGRHPSSSQSPGALPKTQNYLIHSVSTKDRETSPGRNEEPDMTVTEQEPVVADTESTEAKPKRKRRSQAALKAARVERAQKKFDRLVAQGATVQEKADAAAKKAEVAQKKAAAYQAELDQAQKNLDWEKARPILEDAPVGDVEDDEVEDDTDLDVEDEDTEADDDTFDGDDDDI